MRKLLLAFVSVLLVLSSCERSEELVVTGTEPVSGVRLSGNRFYGVKSFGDDASTRGVAQRHKLWYPGSAIKVKFLNGSEEYRQKVRTYAAEWLQYAGITFQYIDEGKADVRIGFDWNEDRYITWSYIGTDCKYERNQAEATMSFADWRRATEEEKKGDVLRAFGMVLGLELEHRHLDFDADWSERIADYWEGEVMDAPWDELREYVFDPLLASEVIMTREYDANSIMIWPFSRRYAGNTPRDFNYELSELDKEFIGQIYPKEEEEEDAAIVIKTKSVDHVGFMVGNDSIITIDWGDGTVENYVSYSNMVQHVYLGEPASYVIKIYSQKPVTNFRVWNEDYYDYYLPAESIDFLKPTTIQDLKLFDMGLTQLDLSNLSNLGVLQLRGNEITSLDISSSPHLFYLEIDQKTPIVFYGIKDHSSLNCMHLYGMDYTSLKLPNSAYLPGIEVTLRGMEKLETIDISENYSILQLNIEDCKNVSTIHTVGNTNLRSLSIKAPTRISNLDLSTNPNLYRLEVAGSINLSNVNLAGTPKLSTLTITGPTSLSTLDLSDNIELNHLNLRGAGLASLTGVSNKARLQRIYCNNNALTSLDISNCRSLIYLDFVGNPFVQDRSTLLGIIETLPTGGYFPSDLYLEDSTSAEWVSAVCKRKRWNIH